MAPADPSRSTASQWEDRRGVLGTLFHCMGVSCTSGSCFTRAQHL